VLRVEGVGSGTWRDWPESEQIVAGAVVRAWRQGHRSNSTLWHIAELCRLALETGKPTRWDQPSLTIVVNPATMRELPQDRASLVIHL
jgi:hypothetical protein